MRHAGYLDLLQKVMCWGTFLCEPSSRLVSFFGLCTMLLCLLCLTWGFVPSAHLDILEIWVYEYFRFMNGSGDDLHSDFGPQG